MVDEHAVRLAGIDGQPEAVGQMRGGVGGGLFAEIFKGLSGKRGAAHGNGFDRITSYNVCYTKLLRYTDYHSAYEGHEGEDIVVGVELWLTASPDMKNYFAMTVTPENELSDRLDELLGLTPDSGNDLIVELWVDPGDLFRPSANPDITDSTGGTGSPATSYTRNNFV